MLQKILIVPFVRVSVSPSLLTHGQLVCILCLRGHFGGPIRSRKGVGRLPSSSEYVYRWGAGCILQLVATSHPGGAEHGRVTSDRATGVWVKISDGL